VVGERCFLALLASGSGQKPVLEEEAKRVVQMHVSDENRRRRWWPVMVNRMAAEEQSRAEVK
jgi:hypothetical protein